MSAPVVLDPADLAAFLDLLRAAPAVKSASTDPSKVHTPGVWVRIDAVNPGPLAAGADVDMTLFPVAGDLNWDDAWKTLLPLQDDVLAVLNEIGGAGAPVTPTSLVLQGSQAPKPALSIPFTLHTAPEETP